MSQARVSIDDSGLRVSGVTQPSCDVYFDEQHVWSFTVPEGGEDRDAARLVPWPRVMRRWLNGTAVVEVRSGTEVVFSAETTFGEGQGRIAFRDSEGIPVMIDKWGLVQRPFTGRGDSVLAEMVEVTERILDIMREDCGVEGWIAFGTLLGAARGGKAIGHDSDIDLAYLSAQPTPAAMATEMFGIARALRRHGLRVLNKSASFVTVLFTASDGGSASIDIYTCFYVGDLLHETATVRAPVPRSAIEPLSTITFEGRELPAPADPDAMLAVSYGPGWRVPDPSFRHQPGPEIARRFEPWFGSVMRNRRDWESHFRQVEPPEAGCPVSGFVDWVARRLDPAAAVVDVGAGDGRDALALAERGWAVTGLDYARGAFRTAHRRVAEQALPAAFEPLNLYDPRDVLTKGAVLVRRDPPPGAVYARGLLDALEPDGRAAFWRLAAMLLRRGGSAYLEVDTVPDGDRPRVRPPTGGRRYPVTRAEVERDARAAGGAVRELAEAPAEDLPKGSPVRRWRVTVDWAAQDPTDRSSTQPTETERMTP